MPPAGTDLRTIAHVDAEMAFSGGEVQVFLLIDGLRRAGWHNVLFAPPRSAALGRARELGIDCCEVSMRNDLDGSAVLRLSRGFRARHATLAHLHTGRATWLGGWAARMAGIPAITTRRMDREVKPGLRSRIIYDSLVRRAVAISPGVADCLRGGGVPEDRVRLIWDGVDPAALHPTASRTAVRRALETSDTAVVMIAVGALVPRKGLDVLIDAVARFPRTVPEWCVWIAGTGGHRDELEERARRAGVAGRLRWLGWRDDVRDLLNASDLLVMPSRREGLGVAALEAMAAGRAVVASRTGGLGQAVVHERTGLTVEPGNPGALALALHRLIADRRLRDRLGAGGPRRIREGFLARQMVVAYSRLYEEVVAERSA